MQGQKEWYPSIISFRETLFPPQGHSEQMSQCGRLVPISFFTHKSLSHSFQFSNCKHRIEGICIPLVQLPSKSCKHFYLQQGEPLSFSISMFTGSCRIISGCKLLSSRKTIQFVFQNNLWMLHNVISASSFSISCKIISGCNMIQSHPEETSGQILQNNA